MTKDILVGLDIGTTKVVVLVGKKNEHNKIEILGWGKAESTGVNKNGALFNIEQISTAVKKAVQQAEAMSGVQIKEVFVGIAGQHIKSRQQMGILTRTEVESEISMADINKLREDMFRLAVEPGDRIIRVMPQEFIVDNVPNIKDPIGLMGVRLEAYFHVITAKINAAENIRRSIERCGLKVAGIELEPLASSAAVLSDDELEAGVALIDIGGGTTDLAIFKERIIRHTSVIPFGGNIITEDIKEGCALMTKFAEAIKLKFGSALASETRDNEIVSIPGLRGHKPKEVGVKNLALIIQSRMEEIIDLVHHQIRSSNYGGKKLIGGIVITGGGSQLKHLKQLVEYKTGLETRIGLPTEYMANSDIAELQHPMYATGIGLLLKGYEEELRNPYANRLVSELDEFPPAVIEQNVEAELNILTQEVEQVSSETAHKESHSLNWWERVFNKGKKIFEEEDDTTF